MTKVQKDELRHKLGIKVMGPAAPAPVCSFAHFGFDDQLMKAIRKSEYVSVSSLKSEVFRAVKFLLFSQHRFKRKQFQLHSQDVT